MMQIYVKDMPKDKSECPFVKWEPFPPCFEATGQYKCRIDGYPCSLKNNECNCLFKLPLPDKEEN